ISGFGQTGPYANLPAFDIVVQAMSGVMSVTGPEGSGPTRVGVSIGDMIPALYGVVSVLGALHHRNLTGEGCHIDLGMLDCLVAVAENAIARYWATGEVPGPIGNRHPVITPFSTFTTADGYLVIAVGNIGQWERFCAAVSRPDLISHPDFESNEARTSNVKLVTETLNNILSANTTEHWLSLLQAAEVPCSRVNSIADVMNDPHLRFRNMLVDVEHPEMGCQTIPGTPIKAIGLDDSITKPAPRLGEHTDSVLKELLGLGEEEINQLIVEGVV
ncbi:MAG: yfdE 2, partial [Dehalococcoidia bacterium]|nr:yfdE 2 [Dehalococcoidia bacterium]